MEKEVSRAYLAQIQRFPLLSQEEEKALAEKVALGSQKAVESLINSNLRLVVSVAAKFNCLPVAIMDLIQEGNMGLMMAAQKFCSSFNTRFSTYAYPWILQYMLRFANSRQAVISLPHRKEEALRKVVAVQSLLRDQMCQEPTEEEIAQYIGFPVEKVKELLGCSYTISSLDVDASEDGNGATVGDLIPDNTYSPEDQFMKEHKKSVVHDMIEDLPGYEKDVIWYRYNFDCDEERKTLRQISAILGVSPEAVRQAEIRALRRLKVEASENEELNIAIA